MADNQSAYHATLKLKINEINRTENRRA